MRVGTMMRIATRVLIFALSVFGDAYAAEATKAERVRFNATIGDKSVQFAFDTGASGIYLFRETVKRLGLKVNEPPADKANENWPMTDLLKFGIFDKEEECYFAVVDVPLGGHPDVEGVIGWRLVRDNTLKFNIGADLGVKVGGDIPAEVKNWRRFNIRREDRLWLEVPEAAGTGVVLIDTGSFMGVELPSAAWKQWDAAHPDSPETMATYVNAEFGLVVTKQKWAKSISIGGLELRDVPVSEAPPHIQKTPTFSGTIGFSALLRIQLIVDGANSVAYVKPSQSAVRPYTHNRLGAVFVPRDDQSEPLMARVAKASPAELAGVQDGDVLLKVDDCDVTQWRTNADARPTRFLEQAAGTKVRLLLERAGDRRTIEVVLKDILCPVAQNPIEAK